MNKLRTLGLAALLALGTATAADAQRPRHTPNHRAQSVEVCNPPKNCIRGDTLTVYFRTNDWSLNKTDINDIHYFMNKHRRVQDWIVEGYADERGSIEANLDLSDHRAKSVATYMRGDKMITAHGEEKPAVAGSDRNAYRFNRRVTIMPGSEPQTVARILTVLPKADAYLLDKTGSMLGGKWASVEHHKYPDRAKLYEFNSCIGVQETRQPSGNPDCETPLWQSMGYVLDRMSPNSSLNVLTDGDDNASNMSIDAVLAKAKQKHIRVSIGAVGVSDAGQRGLGRFKTETGGDFYFVR